MNLDYNESTLPNGVRVLTSCMPQVDSVALGIWARVGGRYESRSASGLSHFIEHLLFKGTRSRSSKEITQAIEGRGGYFNAFTQEESTCYYARITTQHAPDVLEILADMYRRPRFDAGDIDKERGVIIEEIMMYRDQPHQHVQDMLGGLLWTNHSLGRPLIGTPKIIRDVPRSRILSFKVHNYVPGNTLVSLAGRVDHAECVRLVKRLFGGARPSKAPRYTPVTAKTRQSRIAVVGKETEQSHLALGVRLFGRHDRRRFALKLLSVVLGENMSSRLFQVVREKHALAYSVHSGVHLFDDTGALVVSAGLDRARTPKALGLITREMARLARRPVSRAELRRAKDYAIGQMRIGLESTVTQMMWLGENHLGYGQFIQPETVVKRIEAVTADEIQRLAGQVFKPGRCSLALITPEDRKGQEEAGLRELSKLK